MSTEKNAAPRKRTTMPRGVYDRSKVKSKGQKQEKAAKPEKVAAKAAVKAEAPVEKVAKLGKKSPKAQKFEEKLEQAVQELAPVAGYNAGYVGHFGSTQRDFSEAINVLSNLRTAMLLHTSQGSGDAVDLVEAELKRLVPAFGQLVLPEEKVEVTQSEVNLHAYVAPEPIEEAPVAPQTAVAPIAPVFTPVVQATVPFNAPISQ